MPVETAAATYKFGGGVTSSVFIHVGNYNGKADNRRCGREREGRQDSPKGGSSDDRRADRNRSDRSDGRARCDDQGPQRSPQCEAGGQGEAIGGKPPRSGRVERPSGDLRLQAHSGANVRRRAE